MPYGSSANVAVEVFEGCIITNVGTDVQFVISALCHVDQLESLHHQTVAEKAVS
jgi:hypothetical protein